MIAPTTDIAENITASPNPLPLTKRPTFKQLFDTSIMEEVNKRAAGQWDPEKKLPAQAQWVLNTVEKVYSRLVDQETEIDTLKDQVAALATAVAELSKNKRA